jgi:CheY-like chemotaxis protein
LEAITKRRDLIAASALRRIGRTTCRGFFTDAISEARLRLIPYSRTLPMRLLVVEDSAGDLRIATEAGKSSGYSQIEAKSTVGAARVYLEKCLDENQPLPDAIILDLDLGYESGFELLRFWHGTPGLSRVPLIVWTILGEDQREICRLFKVNAYVSKQDGIVVLREALSGLARAAS